MYSYITMQTSSETELLAGKRVATNVSNAIGITIEKYIVDVSNFLALIW